jgi:hypothetical protein
VGSDAVRGAARVCGVGGGGSGSGCGGGERNANTSGVDGGTIEDEWRWMRDDWSRVGTVALGDLRERGLRLLHLAKVAVEGALLHKHVVFEGGSLLLGDEQARFKSALDLVQAPQRSTRAEGGIPRRRRRGREECRRDAVRDSLTMQTKHCDTILRHLREHGRGALRDFVEDKHGGCF